MLLVCRVEGGIALFFLFDATGVFELPCVVCFFVRDSFDLSGELLRSGEAPPALEKEFLAGEGDDFRLVVGREVAGAWVRSCEGLRRAWFAGFRTGDGEALCLVPEPDFFFKGDPFVVVFTVIALP